MVDEFGHVEPDHRLGYGGILTRCLVENGDVTDEHDTPSPVLIEFVSPIGEVNQGNKGKEH